MATRVQCEQSVRTEFAEEATPTNRNGDAVMPERPNLSYECRHQLAEWVRLYCPCATEDSEFLRGLLVIVERELAAAALRHQTTDSVGGTA